MLIIVRYCEVTHVKMIEWCNIKIFLPHADHVNLRRAFGNKISDLYDPMNELIAYFKTWTYKSKPSRRLKQLSRTYLRNKDIPLNYNSMNNACKIGDVLLIKLLLVAGVNIFVPHNLNFRYAVGENHVQVLKLLMLKKLHTSNIIGLVDPECVSYEVMDILLPYIRDNNFYEGSYWVKGYTKIHRKRCNIPRTVEELYYHCLLHEKCAMVKLFEYHMPMCSTWSRPNGNTRSTSTHPSTTTSENEKIECCPEHFQGCMDGSSIGIGKTYVTSSSLDHLNLLMMLVMSKPKT